MTASINRRKGASGHLSAFLSAYASLPLRYHLVVAAVFLMIFAALKLLISFSQPEGIWWQALSTLNLFVVISTLMYGAIFFSQVMAGLGARIMQLVMPGDKATASGCVMGVLLSGLLITLLAPYVLDLIWRA